MWVISHDLGKIIISRDPPFPSALVKSLVWGAHVLNLYMYIVLVIDMWV